MQIHEQEVNLFMSVLHIMVNEFVITIGKETHERVVIFSLTFAA